MESEQPQNADVLKNPDLFNIITEKEFNKTIVGEEKSRKVIFLQCCKIFVYDEFGNLLVGGESSIGKDFVIRNVVKIFPQEFVIYRTRISPKVFTYWHKDDKDWTWNGKILILVDCSDNVLNDDVFKVMCSEGNNTTIVKDGKTLDIKVAGKPIIIVSTATGNPINEVLNRFDLVSLDESEQQTENIMIFQAENAKTGIKKIYDKRITESLKELKPVEVIIPFADMLNKYLPKSTKMRRVFGRFLGYIKASCALHQFQRKRDEKGKVIAEKQDYDIARSVIEDIREQTILGITTTEKKYLEKFENLIKITKQEWFSVPEIHKKTNYKTLQTWWNIMKKLEEKGLIKGEIDELDITSFRPVRKYKIEERKQQDSLKLPIFEEL